MYKLIRKLVPENNMDIEEICSFKTDSYIGIWNHVSGKFVVFEKENYQMFLYELDDCNDLDELYEEVYKVTSEYITAVSDDSDYTFTLDCDK